MSDAVYLVAPVGRLVQGDCFEGSAKDKMGRPRVDKQGNPKTVWFQGVALPKGPEFDAFWAQATAKAQLDFPAGEWQAPTFAWKCEDGDSAKFAGREGFAGCWILRCQGGFAPKVVDNQPQPQPIVDPSRVRKGYYVQVQVSIAGNAEPATGKPGIYVNPVTIMLVGYGPELSSGPPVAEVFAQRGALPPGASLTPVAATVAPGVPGAPQYAAPLQQAPGVPGVPVAAPVAAVPLAVPGVPVAAVAPQYAAPLAVPAAQYAVAPQVAPGVPGVAVAPQYAAVPLAVPGVPVAAPAAQYAVAPQAAPGVPGVPVAGQYAAVPPAVPGVPGVPPAAPGPGVAPAPGFLDPGRPQG